MGYIERVISDIDVVFDFMAMIWAAIPTPLRVAMSTFLAACIGIIIIKNLIL